MGEEEGCATLYSPLETEFDKFKFHFLGKKEKGAYRWTLHVSERERERERCGVGYMGGEKWARVRDFGPLASFFFFCGFFHLASNKFK